MCPYSACWRCNVYIYSACRRCNMCPYSACRRCNVCTYSGHVECAGYASVWPLSPAVGGWSRPPFHKQHAPGTRGTASRKHDWQTPHRRSPARRPARGPVDLTYYYYCLILFSISLNPFYVTILWGQGLRTDMVSSTLSRSCMANIF